MERGSEEVGRDDRWGFFTEALPEIVRAVLAIGIVGFGFWAIINLAFARSTEDAAQLAGLIGGIMGAAVGYYLTKGTAEAADRRADEEQDLRMDFEEVLVGYRTELAETIAKLAAAEKKLKEAGEYAEADSG